MSDVLRIARGLQLDADYVGAGTFALLAKKGAGKSYASRVLAEEMWAARVPFVLFDPLSACWGLRSSADGKGEGIPLVIFGGKHGDAPLERGGGALMADLVIEEGLSMVLDFSDFPSREAEREFAYAFLERLYRRNEQLVHLLVDEADLFAPQKPSKGDERLLGVMDNVVRRGRNKGIGVTLMTQRPAVLNKDVLTQIDGLVAMRVVGLPDREAVDHWVKGHGEDLEAASEVKGSLAGLANGESWWWIPELGILKRVQIRATRTFDSSPSRKRGERRREPKGFADVDLAGIEQRMAETIERAKADDPRELRARIRELEARQAGPPVDDAPLRGRIGELEAELEQLRAGTLVSLRRARDEAVAIARRQDSVLRRLRDVLDGAPGPDPSLADASDGSPVDVSAPAPADASPGPSVDASLSASGGTRRRDQVAGRVDRGPDVTRDGSPLKAGMRRILVVLARYDRPLTRAQLSTLAVVAKGGTLSDYLSALRRDGLIDEPDGHVELADAGRRVVVGELSAARVAELPPYTPDEVAALHTPKLKAGARRMLDVLMRAHPDGFTRSELSGLAGVAKGGTLSDYLSSLRSKGLIEERQRRVYAGPTLYVGRDR